MAADYIFHALEKEKEQAAWDLWTEMYPYMALEWLKPIKFEEFKNKLFQKQYRYTQKSLDEIEKEMMMVVTAYEGHAR